MSHGRTAQDGNGPTWLGVLAGSIVVVLGTACSVYQPAAPAATLARRVSVAPSLLQRERHCAADSDTMFDAASVVDWGEVVLAVRAEYAPYGDRIGEWYVFQNGVVLENAGWCGSRLTVRRSEPELLARSRARLARLARASPSIQGNAGNGHSRVPRVAVTVRTEEGVVDAATFDASEILFELSRVLKATTVEGHIELPITMYELPPDGPGVACCPRTEDDQTWFDAQFHVPSRQRWVGPGRQGTVAVSDIPRLRSICSAQPCEAASTRWEQELDSPPAVTRLFADAAATWHARIDVELSAPICGLDWGDRERVLDVLYPIWRDQLRGFRAGDCDATVAEIVACLDFTVRGRFEDETALWTAMSAAVECGWIRDPGCSVVPQGVDDDSSVSSGAPGSSETPVVAEWCRQHAVP